MSVRATYDCAVSTTTGAVRSIVKSITQRMFLCAACTVQTPWLSDRHPGCLTDTLVVWHQLVFMRTHLVDFFCMHSRHPLVACKWQTSSGSARAVRWYTAYTARHWRAQGPRGGLSTLYARSHSPHGQHRRLRHGGSAYCAHAAGQPRKLLPRRVMTQLAYFQN